MKKIIFFKNHWNHGMTLIETMISGALISVVILATSNVVGIAAKLRKSSVSKQALFDFKSKVRNAINDLSSCVLITSPTAIDPSNFSVQALPQLSIPGYTYDTSSNNKIQDNVTIKTISFQKNLDLNSKFGSTNFTINSVNYWPTLGTINIGIEIIGFGIGSGSTSTINYAFPITITFQSSSSTGFKWTIGQCSAKLPESFTNLGWSSENQSDPHLCKNFEISANTAMTCPAGMYLIGPSQTLIKVPITIYSPSCSCNGSCKGCACIAGSSCSASCDSNGNVSVPFNHCMGTCNASPQCNGTNTTIDVEKISITCCKVLK